MKQLLILFAVILTSISCKNDKNVYGVDCSDNKTIAPQSEIDFITNYINTRNENGDSIQAILHPSGFYYVIKEAGDATRPETCSYLNVDYKGRLFNGNVFDQGTDIALYLYSKIAGWQQAVKLVGKGGKIDIFLPPTLAYGENGSGSIAGNSYLFFEITLNGFN
jgi:FKBP-type peptidyl-prolyl cis-trans isomerase FkpA